MIVNALKSSNSEFPDRLRRLHSLPAQIFILGPIPDSRPSVSIVGARKCSPYGRETALRLAEELAGWGLTVVSGLALGIDGYAHQGAIKRGRTVAVLPGPIEQIYPASHRPLAKQILDRGGSLISEHQPGQPIHRHSFIERNRIIAALGDATVIIEAAEKSGSLSTAQFALEMGKPVLAVPGQIDQPNSIGSNRLIALGARPLLGAQDVLEELKLDHLHSSQPVYRAETPEEQAVLESLEMSESMEQEELAATCKLNGQDLNLVLTNLELKGYAQCLSGKWSLKRKI
ncbi:MAG: DNA-processing protein DprA [Candidatus Saccharimonadales bacterium]|nr:DNA-processing protein DprA [Candidatus Saccharimonadales bacterium]